MKIPLYQVDAFASRAFEGNPAAVCPLQAWLPDGLMQAIRPAAAVHHALFSRPVARDARGPTSLVERGAHMQPGPRDIAGARRPPSMFSLPTDQPSAVISPP